MLDRCSQPDHSVASLVGPLVGGPETHDPDGDRSTYCGCHDFDHDKKSNTLF